MRRRVFVKATVVATKLACRQLTRRRASIRTLFELTLRGSVHDEVRPFGPVLLSVDRSLLPRRPSLATQSPDPRHRMSRDRKSTRLNSSHANISYAVFCLKKKKTTFYFYRSRI